jgi:hypothetical protein
MACRKVLTLILNAAPSAPVQMAKVKLDKIRMVPYLHRLNIVNWYESRYHGAAIISI